MKRTKKKGSGTTVILILVLIIGLSLLLYPTIANAWNEAHQTKAVGQYIEQVKNLDENEYEKMWNDARAYNEELSSRSTTYSLTDEQRKRYYSLLNVGGTGAMGFIEIPDINVTLPVYHGVSESVLQTSIGHLEWTSLPIGGESTHSVLSGHRGLPSALLFTDLDRLMVGDTFVLHILNEVITYEVDKILIVEPQDTDALTIEQGKDLCTLVTCTPYGINSHRLLVRGHRVENAEVSEVVRVTADAMIIDRLIVAPFVLIPILLVMLMWLIISTSRKNKGGKNVGKGSTFNFENLE